MMDTGRKGGPGLSEPPVARPDTGGKGTHPDPTTAVSGVPADGSQPTSRVEPFDIVDEWGCHSFPASDPPANW